MTPKNRTLATQEWLEDVGKTEIIPPMLLTEELFGLSLTYEGAFVILEKRLEDMKEDSFQEGFEAPWHENQMRAAIEVVAGILLARQDGNFNSYSQIMAQTQVGKTGAMVCVEEVLRIPVIKKSLGVKDSLFIQCPPDKSLAAQTKARAPGRVRIGRMSMGTTLKNAKICREEWDNCKTEEDRRELRKCWEQKIKLDGWESTPVIFNNSLVMLDESHYGTAAESVTDAVLDLWGIDLSKDPKEWGLSNVHVCTVSATPMAETLATQDYDWVNRVLLDPGPNYYSMKEMIEDEKIQASWPLNSKLDVTRLCEEIISPCLTQEKNGFSLLRLPVGPVNEWITKSILRELKAKGYRVLKGVPQPGDERNYDVAIVELNEQTAGDTDLQNCLGAPSSGQEKWFSRRPPIPVVVLVKNMLAMGATLNNEHIDVMFERKRKNGETQVDFAVQSLAGRATGYDDKEDCPIIYSDPDTITEYVEWVEDEYEPLSVPPGASRTTFKRIVTCSPHSLTIPQKELSAEQLEVLNPHKRTPRAPALAAAVELARLHGSEELRQLLEEEIKTTDDWSNIYRLPLWAPDSYQHYSPLLQQKYAAGLQGYIQGKKKGCLFLDDDGASYTMTFLFKSEFLVERCSVARNTMYQEQ